MTLLRGIPSKDQIVAAINRLHNDLDPRVTQLEGNTIVVYKNNNEAVTNSTTLQNDDELFFPAVEGERYLWTLWIEVNGQTTDNIKIGFYGPTDGSSPWSVLNGFDASDNPVKPDLLGISSSLVLRTTTTSRVYVMQGLLHNHSADGNFGLRWAQASASLNQTLLTFDSHFHVTRYVDE